MFHDQNNLALRLALEATVGAALVLDMELRIVAMTPSAKELLGSVSILGRRAPQVLCGEGERRPVAEALARGEAVAAEIARPSKEGEQILGVRSVPLQLESTVHGHLLLLTKTAVAQNGITDFHGLITASESMRSLFRQLERVANSDASVLVRGETGSGKELVARALHTLSPRRAKPFLAINCAALPPDLLESELFGHVRGAFTGAVRDQLGQFRQADGGTLFLDEVAELPLAVQAKLLRVTQEKRSSHLAVRLRFRSMFV